MSLADLLRQSIQRRHRRQRHGPPWGSGDQYGGSDILITEDGEPILTEDGRADSGEDTALEQEG